MRDLLGEARDELREWCEAMREAAADYVDWYEWKDRQRAKTCADAIRALPIPEDK